MRFQQLGRVAAITESWLATAALDSRRISLVRFARISGKWLIIHQFHKPIYV
jgi:hypothetical protein